MTSTTALRNQILASALLAFAVICTIAALVYLGVDEPYAIVAGVALALVVKADDARIRRNRRMAVTT